VISLCDVGVIVSSKAVLEIVLTGIHFILEKLDLLMKLVVPSLECFDLEYELLPSVLLRVLVLQQEKRPDESEQGCDD
jgi:hypothetical protein